MYKFNYFEGASTNTFNWVSFLAVLVSLISIFVTLYYIYLTKRMEVINAKFQKLCIQGIDEILKELEKSINNNFRINKFKRLSTDIFSDLQLYTTSLRQVYPGIEVEKIVAESEKFTDFVFSSPNLSQAEAKSKYYFTKLNIYKLIYDYALQKELSLFAKLGLKRRIKFKKAIVLFGFQLIPLDVL